MQRVVENFAERLLGVDRACPEHVAPLVEGLGGQPRPLAQLLSALSGRSARALFLEEMHVGEAQLSQRSPGLRQHGTNDLMRVSSQGSLMSHGCPIP